MELALLPLADAVLPLIRSNNPNLWRYSASNEQGMSMHKGAAILEAAIGAPDALPQLGVRVATPKETYSVAHKALASAIKVIGRADDSAGIIGDACRELIRLHPLAAKAAGVAQLELAKWFWRFHFNEEVDYFNLDPVAYAPALGEKGIARLRSLVIAFREQIAATPLSDGPYSYDHREFLAEYLEQRLAVLDKDFDAIVTTHLREGKVAAHVEDVAEAFEEIGELELAITWAHRALLFDRGHQAAQAANRWWRLLGQQRPEELPGAARLLFDRWPNSTSAARLVENAGVEPVSHIMDVLQQFPDALVRFQLDTLADPKLAWETAHQLELVSAWVWKDLAKAYFPTDPVASIEVQLQIISANLTEAKTSKYRPAALELKELRKAANQASAQALTAVDQGIAELREKYNRRPSFLAALTRARLP
ncbi:hypothetical protein V5R04_09270 [Jonesiaceae bacterium BS-20]|uniref:Uncharacterized protein n=1 Tax=Jonesiaceae bacterium BS-20 TaxID=3120821 RepID=A0AAU7DQG6_9MICO